MTLYCESSAIISVYLREVGRQQVVQHEIEFEPTLCSVLGSVEVRAALARARCSVNPRRLTGPGYERVVTAFQADWFNYVKIPVTDELVSAAGLLARAHLLKAYDAVHLATALALQERVLDKVFVSTWDKELAAAAEVEGLSLAHEVTT